MEPPPDFYGNSSHRRHSQQSTPNNRNPNFSPTPPGPSFSSEWSANSAQPPAVNSPYYSNDFYAQQQSDTYNPYGKSSYADGQMFDQPAYGDPNSAATGGYVGQQAFQGLPQQLMSDPVMNAARVYGGQFAEQQKEKISQFISFSQLKYYFAVDNAYVGKKLAILLFPFIHNDWSVKYVSDEPVPPRFDINAPDLYIPLMAIVTYVVVAGFVLGLQGRFSPEQLGLITSNALVWLIIENLIVLVSKYVMNVSQALSFWHTLALSSYKFVGMIISLLLYLIAGKNAYYVGLVYCSVTVAFFLIRSVKTFVLETPSAYGQDGTKRKLYLLLFISLSQPFIMWILTNSIASYVTPVIKPIFGKGAGAAPAGFYDDIPKDMLEGSSKF